jgi:hypothetical protein
MIVSTTFGCCLEVHVRYWAAGLPAVTCIAADTELNAAARAERLIIEDPKRTFISMVVYGRRDQG